MTTDTTGAAERGVETLLTTKELSEILKIPVRTLEDWRANWDKEPYGPRPIRLGKHVRYRAADVNQFIRELAGAA